MAVYIGMQKERAILYSWQPVYNGHESFITRLYSIDLLFKCLFIYYMCHS